MLRSVHLELLAPVLCMVAACNVGLFMFRQTWIALCEMLEEPR